MSAVLPSPGPGVARILCRCTRGEGAENKTTLRKIIFSE